MPSQPYRVANWREYNQALVHRGSLSLWIDKPARDSGLSKEKPNRQGRRYIYSDQAIISIMSIKAVFRLPYRALEGMVSSIIALSGLTLPVPCFQQIQRRAAALRLNKKVSKKRPTDIFIDASGVKVYGQGEWQEIRNKRKKKGEWTKIRIAMDPGTGEIIVEEATDSNCHDSKMLPRLLKRCPKRVKEVYADGAYDTTACYEVLHQRGISPHIPPRRGAVTRGDPHMKPRDDAICQIVALGGDEVVISLWKKLTGYGRRAHVEGAFSRFKRAFGERLWSRKKQAQAFEVGLKWRILNRFLRLGRPISYAC